MEVFNIHEAKTHLSRLLEKVAKGEPFVIAKSGKPIAKVIAYDAPAEAHQRRLGFLEGQLKVPEDFDEMGKKEIERAFGLDP